MDNLSDFFYQRNLSEKFTRYSSELDYFLDADEEKEFLKIYYVFEELYEESEYYLKNSKALNAYLISGILIDPVESIIMMNGIIKENGDGEKNDIPKDLKEHVESIKKVTYQYLGLYSENPKEYIENLEIDTEAVFEEIMQDIPLEKDDNAAEEIEAETIEDSVEVTANENKAEPETMEDSVENSVEEKTTVIIETPAEEVEDNTESTATEETETESTTPEETETEPENTATEETETESTTTEKIEENVESEVEPSFNMIDSGKLSKEDRERIESEIESLKKQVAEANELNQFKKAYKLQERLIKASKSINPNGLEIRELKEEIKEANDVENYRKGLKLQKKLLKLSKNQDIIDPDLSEKTEQKTLFDDF